ncbi:MAG TPA: NAD(P)H-hydrate dehydratase [Bacillota bacterium]|nr:NAD(P)H-hydrate dehydratase [Bacillota bacterium]HOL08657.1 NAD(P)H-hydrate dehydratase [Bacillota bacterium]HPO96641.1 NAD(P)H-hydrate dehydratase [Bacillota bacterium]
MKVATAAEMRTIDERAQADYGMSGDILMERAALSVLDAIVERWGTIAGKRFVIFCGKGNNGGDGLALARLLKEKLAEVQVFLPCEAEQYSGLAALNLKRALNYGVTVTVFDQFRKEDLNQADLVVDALLGTGSRGVPQGIIKAMIEVINQSQKPVVAIDIPSGIDIDTGQVEVLAVKAELTVTFGLLKPGLITFPGADFAGKVIVTSIGFPLELLNNDALKINYLSAKKVTEIVPKRQPTAHKGSNGHVLVVGGSQGMTGAPVITALGALRIGCGLVTIGIRDGLWLPDKPLEAMVTTWSELSVNLTKYDCIVVGPGMTTATDGVDFLKELLNKAEVPLVIDADALNILAANQQLLQQLKQPVILTPHPGEMSRLAGIPVSEVQRDRVALAQRMSRHNNIVVILKGARTIISLPDGEVYINSTGNPGMATAGMGDALAGVIGGLIAQGLTINDAALAGVYIHGLAGDIVSEAVGAVGYITSDLLLTIPKALGKVLK